MSLEYTKSRKSDRIFAIAVLLMALTGTGSATAQVEDRSRYDRLMTITQLNFGRMITDGRGGSVRIDPVTGERSCQGGVYLLGGKPLRLELALRGQANATVTVLLPQLVRLVGVKSTASVEWHPEYPGQNQTVQLDAEGNGHLLLGGSLVFPPGERFDADNLSAITQAQTLSLQPPPLRLN